MAPRFDVLALSALGLAAAAGIGALIVRSAHSAVDPLSAVPTGAFLVLSVDVAALAESPLGGALVGDAGSRAQSLGTGDIAATCGFDPLPHLRKIAFAVPEGTPATGERGDFGVAVSTTLAKDVLVSCAKALVAKRGGEATTHQVGSFTVVSDARSASAPELALRDGGPVLLGKGDWLAKMIDAADGRAPSTLTAPSDPHAALRAELAAKDRDAEAVRLTMLLPQELRASLEAELAANSKDDRSAKTMDSVLAVSAAALAVHAGRPGDDTRVLAELRCDAAPACDAVSTLLLHTRLRFSGNLGYRLFGLGPLIDNFKVEKEGATLVLGTHEPSEDVAKLVDRALAAGAPSPAKPAPPVH
jgi:hypothetical protein